MALVAFTSGFCIGTGCRIVIDIGIGACAGIGAGVYIGRHMMVLIAISLGVCVGSGGCNAIHIVIVIHIVIHAVVGGSWLQKTR